MSERNLIDEAEALKSLVLTNNAKKMVWFNRIWNDSCLKDSILVLLANGWDAVFSSTNDDRIVLKKDNWIILLYFNPCTPSYQLVKVTEWGEFTTEWGWCGRYGLGSSSEHLLEAINETIQAEAPMHKCTIRMPYSVM